MPICGEQADEWVDGSLCTQAQGHPGDHIPPWATCRWPRTWIDKWVRFGDDYPGGMTVQCGRPATLKVGENLYCNLHRDLGEYLHDVGVNREGRAQPR